METNGSGRIRTIYCTLQRSSLSTITPSPRRSASSTYQNPPLCKNPFLQNLIPTIQPPQTTKSHTKNKPIFPIHSGFFNAPKVDAKPAMLKSLSLSFSFPFPSSPSLSHHHFPDSISLPFHHPIPFSPNSLSSSLRARAKPKELVLGNPTITVEKGKYSYDVETLINKLSSLPPRGSIARCLESFKNRLSLNDFASVFKEFAQRGDWQRSLRLFKYMQRQIWCKPNEHIYTILIGVLGREGLLDKCQEIFEEMPDRKNVV